MKLIIDARYTRTDYHDGISRYTASLIDALKNLVDTKHPEVPAGFELVMAISDPAQLKMLPDVPHVKICSPTGSLELLAARQLNKFSPDVVFSPMQTIGSVGRKFKLLLTLHDLIYYDYPTPPSFLPMTVRWGWRAFHTSFEPQRKLLNRADAVVTVSQTTAAQIAEHKLTKRPVHIVPNAPQPGSIIGADTAIERAERRTKHLLYMGSFMPYKGVETLVEAMKLLPDYQLHLLSKINSADHMHLSALAGANVTFHNGVDESDYRHMLSSAAALLTASRAEGYGLPVVEALAAGCPVVISDIPIFREIAPHAFFAAADQPEDFAQHVRWLEDTDIQSTQVLNGLEDAAAYSWQNSALTLLRVIKDL
ncbi:glycosyltransferase family 1 protein [Rothia sp. ZJ1223]|uniref:glycosyltransferase family 4 protein n=1 Tax=Rothia sp. ZJ1223 TaxID=2811098 RepID=UPI00195C05AB|nr:glycosyltransferase family 4 protein [Rothia sp. ZJ1223]